MHDDNDEHEEDLAPSKTRIKKDLLALQGLGVEISKLNPEQQAKIPMDETLRRAIEQAPSITSNSAKKRHTQYMGKLLHAGDTDQIRQAYDDIMESAHRLTRQLHVVEKWRDDLLDKPEALANYFDEFPNADRQHLRQLVRATQKERADNKPPASARKLFRFIRDELAALQQGDA